MLDGEGQLSHIMAVFSRSDYIIYIYIYLFIYLFIYLHDEVHLSEDVRSDHLCNAEVYLLDDVLYWSGCIWDRRVLPKRGLCGTDFFSECSGDGKQELC